MRISEFDKLTERVLDVRASVGGFTFNKGTFWRRRDHGIIDMVMLDFDTRSERTFGVFVGFNADLVAGGVEPPDCGALAVKYLGGGGLGDLPRKFFCIDENAAMASLTAVGDLWPRYIDPRFDSIRNLEQLADEVENQYLFHKGRLYAAAGAKEKALTSFAQHVSRLEAETQSDEVRGYIAHTKTAMAALTQD